MESFRMDNRLDNAKWFVIVGCVAVNVALGQVVSVLNLPVFLDTIGTILAALLMGPWMGMITGLGANLVWGMFSGFPAEVFAPVSMVIGLSAGYLGCRGLFRSLPRVLVSGILVSIVATLVAAPFRTYFFDGVPGSETEFLAAYLGAAGQWLSRSAAWAVVGTNLIDKVLSCAIAWGIVKVMPQKARTYFPEACPVD